MGRGLKKALPLIISLLSIYACATTQVKKEGYLTASWYGPGFHGRPTASGQIYDMYALTCAHKSLPFGTKLRITNTINGKSVDVVVNDRGPFVDGRDIDLSYGAARKIGLVGRGTSEVFVEYIGRDYSYIKSAKFDAPIYGPFTIQVGSFKEIENAQRLKSALELGYKGVYMTRAVLDGVPYYRVRIGRFSDRKTALRNASVLAEEGYQVIVVGYDEPNL